MRHRWLLHSLFMVGLAGCGAASTPAAQTTATPAASPTPPASPTAASTPTPSAPAVRKLAPSDIPAGSMLYIVLASDGLSADLWLARPAAGGGFEQVRLSDCVTGKCQVVGFALAPDKTRLALSLQSMETFRGSLLMRDLGSGEDTVLVPDGDGFKQLAFAPDGSKLAYLSERTDTSAPVPVTQFNLLAPDGGQPAIIGGEEIFVEDLAWSADGASLLYSRASTGTPPQQWNIYRLPAAGGSAEVVVNEGRLLSQSPDGRRWLVLTEITSERFGLGIYDASSDSLTQVETGGLIVYNADWRADGTIAAVVSRSATEPAGISVFASDAGSIPPPIDTGIRNPVELRWLPDGAEAAIVHATDLGGAISVAQLEAGQPGAGQVIPAAPNIGFGLPQWQVVQ